MAQQGAGGRLAEVLLRASSMLAMGITQQAGRGLMARQPIPQGTVVLQECPLVCAPAPQHRGEARVTTLPPEVTVCACTEVCGCKFTTEHSLFMNRYMHAQTSGVLRLPSGIRASPAAAADGRTAIL
jgi:hypothetical protein